MSTRSGPYLDPSFPDPEPALATAVISLPMALPVRPGAA